MQRVSTQYERPQELIQQIHDDVTKHDDRYQDYEYNKRHRAASSFKLFR
jgi:hypothetical protein